MRTAVSGDSKKRERGSSSAELAILLPLLLLTTVGIVDFGRIVSARNMLSNAARDATRYASVRSIDSEDPATLDTPEVDDSNLSLIHISEPTRPY